MNEYNSNFIDQVMELVDCFGGMKENSGIEHLNEVESEFYDSVADRHRRDIYTSLCIARNIILEEIAKEFDRMGKAEDGCWSSGYYEVDEPGQIVRNMKVKV